MVLYVFALCFRPPSLLCPLAFVAGPMPSRSIAWPCADPATTALAKIECCCLNVAPKCVEVFSDKAERGRNIQIVASIAGLHMLRDDTSPG